MSLNLKYSYTTDIPMHFNAKHGNNLVLLSVCHTGVLWIGLSKV